MHRKRHLLLTNDDGIDAEGLRSLEAALEKEGWEVTVVAPATVMSMCGHRITTETPLRVTCQDARHFAVHGTPADCVRLALTQLCPAPPEWVFSGINHGGNLGADIVVSGTVAAVREAAYAGVPGVAFSHYKKRGQDFDWPWAARCALEASRPLLEEALSAGDYWNINLPHVPASDTLPERVHCPPSKRPLPVAFEELDAEDKERRFAYSGVYADREREPGSDIDACFGGKIAISKLSL